MIIRVWMETRRLKPFDFQWTKTAFCFVLSQFQIRMKVSSRGVRRSQKVSTADGFAVFLIRCRLASVSSATSRLCQRCKHFVPFNTQTHGWLTTWTGSLSLNGPRRTSGAGKPRRMKDKISSETLEERHLSNPEEKSMGELQNATDGAYKGGFPLQELQTAQGGANISMFLLQWRIHRCDLNSRCSKKKQSYWKPLSSV